LKFWKFNYREWRYIIIHCKHENLFLLRPNVKYLFKLFISLLTTVKRKLARIFMQKFNHLSDKKYCKNVINWLYTLRIGVRRLSLSEIESFMKLFKTQFKKNNIILIIIHILSKTCLLFILFPTCMSSNTTIPFINCGI
jgi:hypothetical protein